MNKLKRKVKQLTKIFISFVIILAIINNLKPLIVSATDDLIITFEVEDSSIYELSTDTHHLNIIKKEDNSNNYVDIISSTNADISNEVSTSCNNTNTSCTVTIPNNVATGVKFRYNGQAFDITDGDNAINPETEFSTSKTLTIKEPSNEEPPQPGGEEHNESNFNGKAYLVWSCDGEVVCYHLFDNIPSFDDGNSTFYASSNITDDKDNTIKFDVNAENKFFASEDRFKEWEENYKTTNGVSTINWRNINIEDLIGPDGIDFQPLGEPSDNNAYVSYGDRNFKIVIYNDSFKGVSIGDLSNLHYYPSEWTNPFIRRDQFDISETTKNKPTVIDTILLESTVNIKELPYNGFSITKIEALNVPKDAITVNKVNNEWKIVFSSNFYDNVVFKTTDSNNEVSYFKIKRYTIDGWIKNVNNIKTLNADFYYDRNRSYNDFKLTAKIVYKNGTEKNVTLNAVKGIDDGLGNITDAYEVDEENPEFGPAGKGLKKATFQYPLDDNAENNISKIYLNAEYKGSTNNSYAGAFAGSGKGVLANLFQGGEE